MGGCEAPTSSENTSPCIEDRIIKRPLSKDLFSKKRGIPKGSHELIPYGFKVLSFWIRRCSLTSKLLGLEFLRIKTLYEASKSDLLESLCWSTR